MPCAATLNGGGENTIGTFAKKRKEVVEGKITSPGRSRRNCNYICQASSTSDLITNQGALDGKIWRGGRGRQEAGFRGVQEEKKEKPQRDVSCIKKNFRAGNRQTADER